ncbi:hypothetical protein CCOS2040_20370 [Streptomyces albidoflavus]|nr:hypothetical protein CCOS2040_20370 [Streptomyces albidoflavus]
MRLADSAGPARPRGDDLEALADAVREAARPQDRPAAPATAPGPHPAPDPQLPATRRAHLRVLRSPDS